MIAQFRGHFLTVLGQRPGDIECWVNGTDGFWILWIAHQTDRFTGNAETDGDFRTDRDEIEIVSEDATAQPRRLVPAVVTHFCAHQAGADGDLRFHGDVGHWSTSNLNLYRLLGLYNITSS